MTDEEFAQTIGCKTLSCDDQSCAACVGAALEIITEYKAANSPYVPGPEWASTAPGRSCLDCGVFYSSLGQLENHWTDQICPQGSWVPRSERVGPETHPIRYTSEVSA